MRPLGGPSRLHRSLPRSRAARFARVNRRACTQAAPLWRGVNENDTNSLLTHSLRSRRKKAESAEQEEKRAGEWGHDLALSPTSFFEKF